ncbi:VWA domain-containing protein [Piscinibacter sp.]|uniref:VWA domain-containing protein n=1 Tax=Piscinibacter sp. TaxID=1903157 RepID=UPI002F3E6173
MKTTAQRRRSSVPALAISVLLAACAAAFDEPLAHAGGNDPWPPAWQDAPAPTEFMPPAFDPPSASDCHRPPTTREVPGGGFEPQGLARHKGALADARGDASGVAAERSAKPVLSLVEGSAAPATDAAPMPSAPWAQPQPAPQRPLRETVTAGMVDDNADFGEYLAYRQRHAGMPVRERDISERYLLEVTDASGHPVHDAEVAVQRAGVAQAVMWARTDTAGRVWLHPRAFLSPSWAGERVLGVAVRKGAMQSRALLRRGQAQAVQVRLADDAAGARPRLDLVFLVDATGSMGDEIAKLKASMHAVAQQISQLPGQPDTCYGLVAYRDRGDAFLTRSHDFTDDLGAFRQQLARVHAAGGGDTPEALNEALHEVVHGLSWRRDAARLVVLVADAPPHLDYGGCMSAPEAFGFGPPRGQRADGLGRPGACPQYDTDMQAALAKGIKLFAVGASGLDPVGEYIYRQMAQYTAGRFVFLTYRDAADPGSGPGTQTLHDVKQYSVQTLDRLIVRLVGEEMARLRRG